jgi:hypothetical protein
MDFIVVGQIPGCTIGNLGQHSVVGRVRPAGTDGQASPYLEQEIFDRPAIVSSEDQTVVAQYEDICLREGG